MGSWLSWFAGWLSGSKRELRIIVVGLDGAGKTTIMRRLQTGTVVTTIPTIGFNVETFRIGASVVQMWDLGGQSSIRTYWRCYLTGTDGIVYVVDSCDSERFVVTKAELMALLKESEIAGVPVLILANKSDLPQSQPAAHVAQILDLARINAVSPSHASTVIRPWTIQQTSAVTGQGLDVGMDWLIKRIRGEKADDKPQ